MISKEQVLLWLEEVKDPEIPVLSLVDLGVITEVVVSQYAVHVTLTPTFVGCPALDMMKSDVREVLAKHGFRNVEVEVSLKEPWNSDKISAKGKKALKEFGLAPPPEHHNRIVDLDLLEHAECPNCGSINTDMKSPFGPTLCRSIHHCSACKETFEQFKPV